MRVRDLPKELLLTYCSTITTAGLPPEWIDLDFFEFVVWLDLARKDTSGAVAKWEGLKKKQHEIALLVLPILQKCPALSLGEVLEMLPESERELCARNIQQLATADW